MSQEKIHQTAVITPGETGWHGLYRAAGVGALIAVVFMLLDIALSFGGGDVAVGGLSAEDWFAHLQSSWFVGLRNLGLFNVIEITLSIPLYLALYRLYRKASPGAAALAFILFLVGAAVYIANNRALSMLALSSQYAAASTEAQKSLFAAAGTVILAQAEDFTPGTFLGFFFSNTASVLMTAVMLRARVFRKSVALAGLVGSICLLAFTISATFVPAVIGIAMVFALVGGLLMMVWQIITALGLFRMGRVSADQNEEMVGLALQPSSGKDL